MKKNNPNRWGLKGLFTTLMAFCVMVVLSGVAFGQGETAQIIGTVKDQNGAVVSGANVIVKNDVTGVERTAVTNDEGGFIFTNLQRGSYTVTASKQGFADFKQQVILTVGARFSVEATLGVSGQTADVTVVGGGIAEVNTQEQQLSTVVNQKQITELPTLTRNPYDLVGISANVSTNDPTGRGAGFAINGQRAASTSILLDGAENVNTFVAAIGQSTPLDSVSEFRVVTSNFSAEYGRASGGIVNVATKAGTNEFHGTIYEFNRTSRLTSNGFNANANALPKGVFTRNQFGYSVGGPIMKNKLLFFNSTEWTRVRSTSDVQTFVPTAQLIAASNANTQAFFNAYGQLAPGVVATGAPLTVTQVIAARGVGAGAFANLPGNTPAFQKVRYALPTDFGGGTPQNTYQTVTRIDWNLSDKTQIYGRYSIEDDDFFRGTVANSPYNGYNTGQTDFNQNALISITHQITNSLISQTRLTYNRLTQDQPLGEKGSVPTLYLINGGASISGTAVALPGILPYSPNTGLPFGGPQNVGQVAEDMSWTRGSHTFRFGGQYFYLQDNRTFGAYQTATELLSSTTSYTTALNNFVTGNIAQFQAAVNPQGKVPGQIITRPLGSPSFTRSNRYNEYALYFNDSWRVNSRLTLNLGVRYEYYGVQHNSDPNIESNFFFGAGSNLFQQIRNGGVRTTPQSGGLWGKDKNNWAPRLGFAWDVFGDGKTSVRGGYGIAYERNFGNVTYNVIQNPPAYAVISITAADNGGVPLPVFVSNAGPLAGTGQSTLPATSLRHVREDIVNAYAHFWSASFERQVAKNTVASVQYSGSAGRDLYSLENYNRVGTGTRYLGGPVTCPFPSPTDPTRTRTVDRLSCIYTNINTRANGGYSDYNALIAALESSNLFNTGLTLTARYTFASTKDNLSSTFSESGNNFNLGLLDPFNPSLDYGYSDFDTRHRFVSSFVWELPFMKNASNPWAKHILGGWSLTGIASLESGAPFTIFDCTTANFTVCMRLDPSGPVAFGAPDRLVGTPDGAANRFLYIDLRNLTPTTFMDVSGGQEVGPYPASMTARNSFRGPGYWNVDLGFYKSIRITERYKLQFRGELYNIFNHANLFIDGGNAEINSGWVQGFKAGRRNVQLALKFIF